MTRYRTTVADGTVYVESEAGRLEVGDLDVVLDIVGGPSWTITYTEREKRRHPDLDTADEGITVDVRDTIHAMTFDEAFVETLAAQPAATADDAAVSPRLGLFVGRLLENLEYGVR